MKFAVALMAAVVMALAVVWATRHPSGDTGVLTLTGTVEATQVDVSPKITGRIVQITAREGQVVERGQLLVRLDAQALEAEMLQAEAARQAAEAQLRNLQAGARREEIREAEARAARARAQLDDLLAGPRAEEIEQARAALHNAAATRGWSERELSRARELYGRDLIAAQEVDRARQSYEVAAANETQARERLRQLEAGPRTHEVRAARAELQAAVERVELLRAGPRPQEVEAARARVTEATAALALARSRVAETRLFSPLTGVVLRKNAEVGETINAGVSVLTLMDPRDVWLRAYVPETEIGRIKLRQAASVIVDAYPGRRFAGRISEIASEAEFTPRNVQTRKERVNLVFRVKITVQNPDGVLKPGLPADAEVRP